MLTFSLVSHTFADVLVTYLDPYTVLQVTFNAHFERGPYGQRTARTSSLPPQEQNHETGRHPQVFRFEMKPQKKPRLV